VDAPALVNVEMSGSEFSCPSRVVFSAMNMKLPWKQLQTLHPISSAETIAIIRRCPHLSICFLVNMYEMEFCAGNMLPSNPVVDRTGYQLPWFPQLLDDVRSEDSTHTRTPYQSF
jgi:hypothetical protein